MTADVAAPEARRRWTLLLALGTVLLIVAGVAAWADTEAKHYYTYQPGTAPLITTSPACRPDPAEGELVLPGGTPCARLVVPATREHAIRGRLLMVDVLVGPANAFEYILHEVGLLGLFEPGSALKPAATVLGPAPPSQLGCEDTEEMAGAQIAAPVAALTRLHYHVRAVQHGAQVFLVAPGTPATRAGVRCNDVITAVDGRPVRSAEQLTAAIRSHRPGTRVAVTVRRGRRSETLHPVLTHLPAQGGHPAQPHTAFLGVEVQDDTTYTLPFDVHIDVGNIGGPSAGLALTLGLLDTLSGGRLTGGHTVAATGTITPTGQVGPVGGVAQKSVAITRAGARLFLVPPDEYRTALRRVGAGVKVEEVTSLAQALADLRAIGGSVPPATGAGAS